MDETGGDGSTRRDRHIIRDCIGDQEHSCDEKVVQEMPERLLHISSSHLARLKLDGRIVLQGAQIAEAIRQVRGSTPARARPPLLRYDYFGDTTIVI